jgi:signal transduction histidine kinase
MQLNVILDGLAGDLTEKQEQILRRTSDRIKSLTALSTELLDLSKIESGLIHQDREELELTALIKDQIAGYRDRAAAGKVDLVFKEIDREIRIMANRTNIEEVLSNLISNAIRYSPNGGTVTLELREKSDCINIMVSDTGLGIPEKDLGHVFDRFFRAKNEKTRYINGTGLGLAIVKSIVEAHHGTIEVESELDKGTCFSVYLPKATYKI